MSQENQNRKPPRRRDSILKTRQVVEGEVEEEAGPVGFRRRVSFRNVKEIQFFNTDTKNCPELLHAAEPLKEKINETLGSDGVITPGRSSTLHSHHSSKNNTMDMFGDKAQKPIPMVQQMHVETLVIEEEVDPRANATTRTVVDMDISEVHTAKELETSAAFNPDDTMNLFRPFRPGKHDDSSAIEDPNTTMALFTTGKEQQQQPTEEEQLNATMDMFRTPAKKEGGGEEALNDTMDLFRSPRRKIQKKDHSPAVVHQEEEILNSTMDLFRGTARPATLNVTCREVVDMEMSAVEAPPGSRTIIAEESLVVDSSQMDISIQPAVLNNTMDAFQPAAAVAEERPKAAAVPEVVEEKKAQTPVPTPKKLFDPNSTMAAFQTPPASQEMPSPAPTPTSALASASAESLNATMDMFRPPKLPKIKEDPELEEPSKVDLSKIIRELPELEQHRRMDMSMTVSDPIEVSPNNPLMETKAQMITEDEVSHRTIEEPTVTDTQNTTGNVSMISSMGGGDTTMKASFLSQQSRRSRRRSSLGAAMRESMAQSPQSTSHSQAAFLQALNPNTSLQEQLSFFRNTLFDSRVVRTKKATVAQLRSFMEEDTVRVKAELEELLPKLAAEAPIKAAAAEALNCRMLGALDRDDFMDCIKEAENAWFAERGRLAAGNAQAAQEQLNRLEAEVEKGQRAMELCKNYDQLEAEVAEMEKIAVEDEGEETNAITLLEEEIALEREIAKLDIDEQSEKRKALEKEMAYIKKHAYYMTQAFAELAVVKQDVGRALQEVQAAIRCASKEATRPESISDTIDEDMEE